MKTLNISERVLLDIINRSDNFSVYNASLILGCNSNEIMDMIVSLEKKRYIKRFENDIKITEKGLEMCLPESDFSLEVNDEDNSEDIYAYSWIDSKYIPMEEDFLDKS